MFEWVKCKCLYATQSVITERNGEKVNPAMFVIPESTRAKPREKPSNMYRGKQLGKFYQFPRIKRVSIKVAANTN